MSLSEPQRSTDEWMLHLGNQLRALRIRSGLDQTELAALANSSTGAIKNLENGKGSSLKTLIKVIRALNRTDWLELLAPMLSISPMQILKAKHKNPPRMKVYRARRAKTDHG
ncbi:helix-turn-helix domain-containing protein [Mycoavidus sp. B2-EB]|uniref:helix-turn-helix domain-containing protein n=1 Tax=Mycoavidus sp. B2-EB TaxID=2651972 RepID=UPI001629B4EF|nr:helix-turn-helix transcriptional regulator [Mycoavidus sp. B2-EB]BBO59735.1 transcriptional regulator [Mycoavidus sp. B2-EB]